MILLVGFLKPASYESFIHIGIVFQLSSSLFTSDAMGNQRDNNQRKEEEGKWRDTQHTDPFSSKHSLHRSAQSLRYQVHSRHDDQGHKEGKGQSKNDCPTQRPPKCNVITAKENVRIQFAEEGNEIDVEAKCDGNKGEDSCYCS